MRRTFEPEHPVRRSILSGDEHSCWKDEAGERSHAGVPPYGRLAGIILSSTDVQEVFDLGNALARNDAPLRRAGAQVFADHLACHRHRQRIDKGDFAGIGVACEAGFDVLGKGVCGDIRAGFAHDIGLDDLGLRTT